jgi:long-chain acyl-CoA synthetase
MVTYGELKMAVDRFASFLQNSLLVQKGDRIAIMMPNILQFAIAELAALKIGAICVNTNPLYTPREMLHQFVDSGVQTIVILDLFVSKLEEIISNTKITNVIVTSIGDQLPAWKGFFLKATMRIKKQVPPYSLKAWPFKAALAAGNPKALVVPNIQLNTTAILQYTGGTTGVSKGAMLSNQNILANMLQIQALTKGCLEQGHEVVLTALPLYHIFALSVNFLSFLADGQHIILVPKPTPIDNTAKLFKQYRITVMTGVNTLFNSLNNSASFKSIAPRSLKVVVAGGMALQDSVNKTFQSITGVPITEGFGLTECSPVTHVNPVHGANPVGSIGLPLPSTFAKIVGSDGQTLLPGETGELAVMGPQVMTGYWNREAETGEMIKDGWLWTGDIARMDERGYFYIVDRKKDMVLVSGFNVYPSEVEEVLCNHPQVLEAAVIGVPDKSSGEAVKAFIVLKDLGPEREKSREIITQDLRRHCKEALTGYKCPRQFEFMDALPKSNVGKILRRELRVK